MKIAILSSASAGGAGIAAYRIYQALKEKSEHEVDFFDISTFMEVVNEKVSLPVSGSNKKYTNTHFTIDYSSETRDWVVNLLSLYDVVNIHWASYLISLSEIVALAKMKVKILFTLHDFYYMTGGCHYPAGCTGFLKNCGACPQLDANIALYSSIKVNYALKREVFSYPNVLLSAPSEFIVRNAIESGIVPHERAFVLRNVYEPLEKARGKNFSGRNILLIADSFSEKRKGLQLAVDALKLASVNYSNDLGLESEVLNLLLVGNMTQQVIKQLENSPINIRTYGHVKEHSKLVAIFQQCHFILTCSFEDNWPNTLVESGSYGCIPIVGRWHGCEEFSHAFGIDLISENYTSEAFSFVIRAALSYDVTTLEHISKRLAANVRRMHKGSHVVNKYIDAMSSPNYQLYDVGEKRVSLNFRLLKRDNSVYDVVESPFRDQSILGHKLEPKKSPRNNSFYGIENLKKVE